MPTSYFIVFVLFVILVGVIWRIQVSRLANRLFGPGYRVRYVHRRWVIEATRNGRIIKYTTGGMGFVPALSYLFLESCVSTALSITEDQNIGVAPEEIRTEVSSLRRKRGFKRLDIINSESSLSSTMSRITWFRTGEGILLRRYTRQGGDPSFVGNDLELIQRIADALMPDHEDS